MPSSSLTAAARSQYLLDLLAQLPDPRKRRGRRHWLAGLLAAGIAAVTAGSRSFAAIGQWAADTGAAVLARLGAVRGPTEESTFRRDRQGHHAGPVQAAEEATLDRDPRDLGREHGPRTPGPSTIKAVLVPARTGFAGAAQVAQVRRTVTRKGKKTVEVVYLITSDRGADPATLAAWARDVTYQEDKSLVRTGNAARVMASLRSLAISLLRLDGHASIAAANRHHATRGGRWRDAERLAVSLAAGAAAAGLPL